MLSLVGFFSLLIQTVSSQRLKEVPKTPAHCQRLCTKSSFAHVWSELCAGVEVTSMTANKQKREFRSMNKALPAHQATSQSPSTQSADHRQEPAPIPKALAASRPSYVLDNAEKARGEHSANSVWRRSVSMERGQEAAEEVPAEYHLPPRQRARGGSSKYASALPGAYSMLYSRIKAMEDEVRTIKALAMSKDEKQYHEPRNKLVEGVRRAERMEAAAQKVPVAKRCKLFTESTHRPIQSISCNVLCNVCHPPPCMPKQRFFLKLP